MFYKCEKLQGGAGTTYNSSKLDKTYALIDGTGSQPGYFTAKPKACAGNNTDLQAQIKKAVCNHEVNFNHADGYSVFYSLSFGFYFFCQLLYFLNRQSNAFGNLFMSTKFHCKKIFSIYNFGFIHAPL